jgi:hypothetical protein
MNKEDIYRRGLEKIAEHDIDFGHAYARAVELQELAKRYLEMGNNRNPPSEEVT